MFFSLYHKDVFCTKFLPSGPQQLSHPCQLRTIGQDVKRLPVSLNGTTEYEIVHESKLVKLCLSCTCLQSLQSLSLVVTGYLLLLKTELYHKSSLCTTNKTLDIRSSVCNNRTYGYRGLRQRCSSLYTCGS